jgi:glycosyl transferase family 25
MRTVVINLEPSLDRRELMQHSLARLGIEFEFFRGVNASSGEHLAMSRYDEQASLLDHGMPLTRGEIGCFASHYLLWQRCVTEQRPILIMEDDLIIHDGFLAAMRAAADLMSKLPMIRLGLGYDWPHFEPVRQLADGLLLVRYAKNAGLAGTLCYALSPRGAAALVAHAAVWSLPVDHYLNCYTMHGLESYSIRPLFISHADLKSYPSVIDDRGWQPEPPLSVGARIKREILRFKRDKRCGPYQVRYGFSRCRCMALRLLGKTNRLP